MDSSCKLEYTAGIETESWLIGELTFKTAKGEQTEILTGDLLYFGISPQVSAPRMYVRLKPDGGFNMLFVKTLRLGTRTDSYLEIIADRKDRKVPNENSLFTSTICIWPYFPEGQRLKVIQRMDVICNIIHAAKMGIDPKVFPFVASLSVPIYIQAELDRYEAHLINTEDKKRQNELKAKRTLMSAGTSCSKRARQCVLSVNGHNPPKSSSVYQSAYRSGGYAWMASMKAAQGRAPLPRQSAPSSDSSTQPKITSLFSPRPNLEGFRNLGNTCYMSAVVSVLLSLPALASDMERFAAAAGAAGKTGHAPLSFALRELFRQVGARNHGVLGLGALKEAVAARARRFRGREQHDAHEFFSSCIDLLTTEQQQVLKHAADDSAVPPAAVTDLNLRLRVRHTLVCAGPGCEYRRSRGELFRDVSLCIPDHGAVGAVGLDELLDAFFSENRLEYTCEKCGYASARAVHKVTALPRYLVLHLKRFQPDYVRGVYEKSAARVDVPFALDISRHCAGPKCSPPALPDEAKVSWVPSGLETDVLSARKTCDRPSAGRGGAAPHEKGDGPVPKRLEFEGLHRPAGGRPSGSPPAPGPRTASPAAAARSPPGPAAAARRSENADLALATAYSKEEAGGAARRGLPPPRDYRFDTAQFTLGDEEEDLRRALALSQELASDENAALAAALAESARAEAHATAGACLEIDLVDDADDTGGAGAAPASPESDETAEECAGEGDGGEEDDDDDDEGDGSEGDGGAPADARYRLHAVVSHSGATAGAGHYVSDVYDAAHGRWRRFDDSLVTTLTQAPAEWARGGYLFVYAHAACFR